MTTKTHGRMIADASVARLNIGPDVIPAGTVWAFAGTSDAPPGWLFCTGVAVSRTEFAGLFSVIGTTYGAGNGTTTFNLPDLRGRVVAGRNNMGNPTGPAENRLTTAGSGVDGSTIGASGGAQSYSIAGDPVSVSAGAVEIAQPIEIAIAVQPTLVMNWIIKA